MSVTEVVYSNKLSMKLHLLVALAFLLAQIDWSEQKNRKEWPLLESERPINPFNRVDVINEGSRYKFREGHCSFYCFFTPEKVSIAFCALFL